MKSRLSKTEAKEKIDSFFKRDKFTSEEMRKIKRLAMKYKIKLGNYRKLFCKKCLSKLNGKVKINRGYKTVEWAYCNYKNKFRI